MVDIGIAINQFLDAFDTRYFTLVAALAGVGIASMAILQGLKALPLEALYH